MLVLALIPALPQHEKTVPHLQAAANGDIDLCVSTHISAECYASLTTLPISPQVAPGQAHRLIRENIADNAQDIISLDADDYLRSIQRMAELGLRSGAIYDALHVRCADHVSAQELRTFNGQDFRRMPPADPTQLVVL